MIIRRWAQSPQKRCGVLEVGFVSHTQPVALLSSPDVGSSAAGLSLKKQLEVAARKDKCKVSMDAGPSSKRVVTSGIRPRLQSGLVASPTPTPTNYGSSQPPRCHPPGDSSEILNVLNQRIKEQRMELEKTDEYCNKLEKWLEKAEEFVLDVVAVVKYAINGYIWLAAIIEHHSPDNLSRRTWSDVWTSKSLGYIRMVRWFPSAMILLCAVFRTAHIDALKTSIAIGGGPWWRESFLHCIEH